MTARVATQSATEHGARGSSGQGLREKRLREQGSKGKGLQADSQEGLRAGSQEDLRERKLSERTAGVAVAAS